MNEIWKWYGDDYVAHCCRRVDYETLMQLSGVRHRSKYLSDGPVEYDILFPARQYNRVASQLGLRQKKSKTFGSVPQRLTG